ncbi:hypothetical protein [Bacillus altitudinis]|uniref:hypothetical protein n=1 Tax=Bacillus altitudinis TaxID=293387 RepID=UPI0020D183CA|nr:hypothetical protein [Bacillus altitudinis]
MDFISIVSMPVITAIATILVAFISFILGRINENYKTNLEYRTFLDVEEIISLFNLGGSHGAKNGKKILLHESYQNFQQQIRDAKTDPYKLGKRFSFIKLRVIGKSFIIGGEVTILFDLNGDTKKMKFVLPILQPNEDIYIPIDLEFEKIWDGKRAPIKEIKMKYRLQTGQRMRFISKRIIVSNGKVRMDSYEIFKLFRYTRIHSYIEDEANWVYTPTHE